MTVFLQPKSPNYVIEFWFRGKRFKQSSRTPNKRDAQLMEQQLRAELKKDFAFRGRQRAPSLVTLPTPEPEATVSPRRGLPRANAALYVGVGVHTFDALVKAGRMPKPKQIGESLVWDIREIDVFFEVLPVKADARWPQWGNS